MGWSSGGEVFDPVARLLVQRCTDDDLTEQVCYLLASTLADRDWDTLDESVEEFAGFPEVQHALRKAAGSVYLDNPGDGPDAELTYDARADVWRVRRFGQAEPDLEAPGTVTGFNAALDVWARLGGTPDHREYADRLKLQ